MQLLFIDQLGEQGNRERLGARGERKEGIDGEGLFRLELTQTAGAQVENLLPPDNDHSHSRRGPGSAGGFDPAVDMPRSGERSQHHCGWQQQSKGGQHQHTSSRDGTKAATVAWGGPAEFPGFS